MTTFYGYSTIDKDKKFRLEDRNLIIRDILNSFGIKQGEKLNNPTYGSAIWNYVYENLTKETLSGIDREIKRTVEQDPRVKVESTEYFPEGNGLLVEIVVTIVPSNETELLKLFFTPNNQSVRLM